MVRPGSRGDLVLLDADPLAPYPDAAGLTHLPVALTAVAGTVVHSTL
jgi:predicted amidohydrolase YtcJ